MDLDRANKSETLNLLLLPAPPSSSSLADFRAAYAPALTEILKQLSARSISPTPPSLDIALWWDDEGLRAGWPRSSLYQAAQQAVATIYKLLCSICAESHIGEQYKNDVDFRVVLTYDRPGDRDENRPDSSPTSWQGPFVPLQEIAWSARHWENVFAPDGENSERFLQDFIKLRRNLPLTKQSLFSFKVHRMRGGTSVRVLNERGTDQNNPPGKRHLSVAVGGTFDHLHAGHKLLLTATCLVIEPILDASSPSERTLTIGITGDELLKNKKYAESLESWDVRQNSVYNFLSAVLNFRDTGSIKVERTSEPGPNGNMVIYELDGGLKIRCVEISDPFGPTITDKTISALVISGETRAGGKAVNDRRVEKGWDALEIFEVEVLDSGMEEVEGGQAAGNFQSKISSTEIRKRLQEESG